MLKGIKPEDAVCLNCVHGTLDERSQQVICHFNPPTPILMQVPNPAAIQTPGAPSHALVNQALPPTLNPDWWCAQGVNRHGHAWYPGGKVRMVQPDGKVQP